MKVADDLGGTGEDCRGQGGRKSRVGCNRSVKRSQTTIRLRDNTPWLALSEGAQKRLVKIEKSAKGRSLQKVEKP